MAGGPIDLRDEEGETLIEILVTVILLGLAVVGIMSGVFAVTRLAEYNARTSNTGTSAQSWAEEIKQPVLLTGGTPTFTYVECAASYPSYSGTLPSGGTYTASITQVRYLTGLPTTTGLGFDGSCTVGPTSTDPDLGIQRITAEVSIVNGSRTTTETVTFLKRDARCDYSTSFVNTDQGPC